VTAATTFDEQTQTLPISAATLTRQALGCRTDPLQPAQAVSFPRPGFGSQSAMKSSKLKRRPSESNGTSSSSGDRLRAQLPAFAPLLEELEVAGWSASAPPAVAGNFHDWLLVGSDRLLVAVGHAANPESRDTTEPTLVAQAAWTAIRAHAVHTRDAGTLLSLAAQTLWPAPDAATRAAVAVALVDTTGGQVSIALAGDCLAWRIRAASCEQFVICQPSLGLSPDFAYMGQSFELSLRERLILAVDDTPRRPPKLATAVASTFSHLDAESHRRMTASDAVSLVSGHYEPTSSSSTLAASASIAAIRRR
jgi:hypothetical protein